MVRSMWPPVVEPRPRAAALPRLPLRSADEVEAAYAENRTAVESVVPKGFRVVGPPVRGRLGPQCAWRFHGLAVLATVEPKADGRWLHVSLSRLDRRMPRYEDLAAVRKSFFRATSVVVQVFPPVDEHYSFADVLHLWERLDGPRLVPDLRIVEDGLGVGI